jgi:hypothetical protein
MCLDPALSGMVWIFVIAMSIIGALLTVIPFWRILTKAGLPGPLALLMLVPVANIILPFYVAFTDWPVLRNRGGGSCC